jgi:hypothetical protein
MLPCRSNYPEKSAKEAAVDIPLKRPVFSLIFLAAI